MSITNIIQGIKNFGLRKFFSVLLTFILAIVVIGTYATIRSAAKSINYALSPPELPLYQPASSQLHLDQNWSTKDADWFHHVSQGSVTIPIPYQWFVSLEKPKKHPLRIIFGDEGRFIENSYLLRMGFVKGKKSTANPDGLPYGFAKTKSHYFEGLDRKTTAIGFTCAACHTGHLTYNDTEYVIEGGTATIDTGLFTKALGAALAQTALSSKLPILNGRFSRFAERVLGENLNPLTKASLKKQLIKSIRLLAKTVDIIDVREGYSRLDALNRIGNQVFARALDRRRNYTAIAAPVNFPHIWTVPWFNWVQYDGSIMQPLIRNSGEALGVKAYVNTTAPQKTQRFASSVHFNNLYKIETLLAGENPTTNNRFGGLQPPKWPDSFPSDSNKHKEGEKLYNSMCRGCHLPVLSSKAIWDTKYFAPITYTKNGVEKKTESRYLHLKIIPLDEIGTDPEQANVLATRTIDTTELGLDIDLCTNAPRKPSLPSGYNTVQDGASGGLVYVPFEDSPTANFGLALGAFVAKTNNQWMQQNYIPKQWQPLYEGDRPNCLQVAQGYKARPLNGIWATAPFLHNGSVPTLYDLLSPLAERPTLVQLGDLAFDAQKVGVKQPEKLQAMAKKTCAERTDEPMPEYVNGLFILDACTKGNRNIGHQFEKSYVGSRSDNPSGVIGRELTVTEREALVEYLKTL